MALQDITITGSIGTYPTLSYGQKIYISSTDEESFPIEEAVGGNGGSLPNLFGQTSSIDLFSPIDQKWSGYNDTPAGLVAYTESFQNEFINGEFSGSNYVVTNGELTDPDCKQFLEVNTTLVNYNPFIYNAFDTPISEGSFLNPNVSPNPGEVYIFNNKILKSLKYIGGYNVYTFAGSITYIKVNRFDNQGNDNTLSLQELTNLRLSYTDLGIINYPILTRSEYPTYYLYRVNIPISYTNPYYEPFIATPYTVDNNVLNYNISSSKTGSTSIAGNSNNIISNYNNTLVNTLGYFNSTTGITTFNSTPNTTIYLTASVTVPDQYLDFILIGSSEGKIITVNTSSISGGELTLSASFVPIENNIYYLVVYNNNAGSSSYSNVNLLFTQSYTPHSSSNLTVLEPYLTQNFYYNDCNALFGNEDGLEYYNRFMKVNYDNGYAIPSNQSQIISGTAEPAPVKSYNYSLYAQIFPRYNGVKLVQQNENVWTRGDIAPSQTPSVSTPSTYFAYFDWAGGTNNDLYDKQAFHITYLIDISGSVFTPSLNPPYYPNLIDLFPSGKKANILPYSINGSAAQIQGTQSIYYPGVLPTPIIYSQIGYTDVVAPSMSFQNALAGIPNYGSSLGLTNGATYSSGYYNILDITSPSSCSINFIASDVSYNSGGTDNNFQINTSTNKTQVIPTLSINLKYLKTTGFILTTPVTLSILKYASGTWSYLTSQNIIVTSTTNNFTVTAPPQTATSGDKYRITISYPGTGGNVIQYGGTFNLTQTTPPSLQQITASYWETGSSSKNILTGSVSMNSSVYNLTMTSVSNSGYFDCLPFNVQRLDEIRFEADENQKYKILEVSSPLESTDGRLYLTLDRNIDDGTDLDSFFLRRLKPDPSFVVMDIPISPGSAGFLLPEFISQDLKDNLPNIISNLHQKNLI